MEKNNEPFFKQNFIFGCLIGGTFIFASLLFILAGKGIVVKRAIPQHHHDADYFRNFHGRPEIQR